MKNWELGNGFNSGTQKRRFIVCSGFKKQRQILVLFCKALDGVGWGTTQVSLLFWTLLLVGLFKVTYLQFMRKLNQKLMKKNALFVIRLFRQNSDWKATFLRFMKKSSQKLPKKSVLFVTRLLHQNNVWKVTFLIFMKKSSL